ncbi:MAG: trifunctional transcriptional regulator/proline dehydrogenase/L-glutamate gamma-semialdehyde dehydrogenase [Alphaproteobacteria bacterium]|nr:trifunctional transcriptional regulator/proline dehydrogenase/L-glutamate gamma-semialdehyde dehydrogenase [Alphaproteobacteria bacterium]MCW5739168.1 trifunctional transcriptional regulator/proline dehydrogenase/L-glutamate gamma-semialdehyde dehydrogenase [Alphaproteobacteria bacterium]
MGTVSATAFADFRADRAPGGELRQRIRAAYRTAEPRCVPPLIERAALPPETMEGARAVARRLIEALRADEPAGGVESLMQEYALSTDEGIALMCLAEALLRIPDADTRDALIRDKIGGGDWRSHVGQSPSLFVNAATWGLVVTGRLTKTANERTFATALVGLIARGGEPLIRKAVDLSMRMLGEQFVAGETIGEALERAIRMEERGFRFSYDMLGEAAVTAAEAERYHGAYEAAIHAIGAASQGRGIHEGPGISIKLSALHPRYARAQRHRVLGELLPRLRALALLARRYDIGLNIDAEEADRLDLSLEMLEALCFEPGLARWDGIGFVVQAYQKRAPFVIDYLIDLARRSRHRLMLRLVKGAYWDSEIKRAQLDGLPGYPVYTRKVHTDVAYIACARTMLGAADAVFPQFATHNALTLATIHAMAGHSYYQGQYEFQCLHGMGEPLYEEVVPRAKLNRPCRIYAPVGTHESLLAYLVRRLLENGANSSFVNQLANPKIPVEALLVDPVAAARALEPPGRPHDRIVEPAALFMPARRNSIGLDLSDESVLEDLARHLPAEDSSLRGRGVGESQAVLNPSDRRDCVGFVAQAYPSAATTAVARATDGLAVWSTLPPSARAERLERAADLMEARMPSLLDVIVREAGKTLANAVGEVREAVDFLRYYAVEVRERFANGTHRPLGVVVCISPWNFPLAIFTGQVAAALAAGNAVIAKPAEETPLTAIAAVRILHEAGVPDAVLQLMPGEGDVGAALVAEPGVRGVVFTGSTQVARLIQREIARRANPDGAPVPLIAETGGQNALIVDSSALPEQVVQDVVQSAFDSAGQRCSALRVLCLQDDIAERVLAMLRGALREISVGPSDRLSSDVGPVITEAAKAGIVRHIGAMRAAGHAVEQAVLSDACAHGIFVAPTLIEIGSISALKDEVFGPVLHVLRYRRRDLDRLIGEINATGYGLTFGVHSRIDETIEHAVEGIEAGNIYVNRNLIGAVVGVQPFGGHGLSGTGPKAGGPLYLYRLLSGHPGTPIQGTAPAAALRWAEFLRKEGVAAAELCEAFARTSPLGHSSVLRGPVGERNTYSIAARGRVLCAAGSKEGLAAQIGAALSTGNVAIVWRSTFAAFSRLPADLRQCVDVVPDDTLPDCDAALIEVMDDAGRGLARRIAAREGRIIPLYLGNAAGCAIEQLVRERSVSVNTAAAGGNASLVSL